MNQILAGASYYFYATLLFIFRLVCIISDILASAGFGYAGPDPIERHDTIMWLMKQRNLAAVRMHAERTDEQFDKRSHSFC